MLNNFVRVLALVAMGWILSIAPLAAASCESLASLDLPGGKITAATPVAAGAFVPPGGGGMLAGGPGGQSIFKSAPAFCRVTATLTPTPDSDIKIEVWMPIDNWNGKLVGIGNGVWAGNISYSALAEPLARGYATVATDTGHVGSGMDGKFAVGHPEKLVDFGHRAVHEMTVKAKAILASYYGRKEQRSLWVSCSTGGRQGLMEAYRYPDDYDGISSMAPANPMVGLMIGSLWTGYAAMKEEARKLTMPKMRALNNAFINQCDGSDGLKDGIVGNPEQCGFDPATIRCKEGDREDCLTDGQIAAMRDIYAGARNSRTGELIFAGFPPGSEQQVAMLAIGKEPFPVATSYFRDIVFNNPQWDFKSFDYDRDLAASFKAGSDILDVPSDGLTRFIDKGGKLLLSHGWADGLIPAGNTAAFYKAMTAKMDPKKAADSVRLFMLPGVGHCGGGDAPGVTDMLSTIDQWVETGKAPERILASNAPNQKPMTRPVCPYPQIAQYKGSGSADNAENFECRTPAPQPESAPVPAAVAIARPTTEEFRVAERSLAKFLETAEPAVQEINRKYPGLISVRMPPANSATVPFLAPFFQQKHQANLEVAKKGDSNVLFMGDSITDFWRNADGPYAGKPVLDKYFGHMKVANFGIAGDTTQGVLYRLQHGEGQGFSPRAVMLMIGTNNTGRNTAAEIAEGIGAVVLELQKSFPKAKILLLGIFPRSTPNDPVRATIAEINSIIAKLHDGDRVHYLDIGAKFLDASGAIPKDVMSDALHPSAKGYEIWAEAVKGPLENLMK